MLRAGLLLALAVTGCQTIGAGLRGYSDGQARQQTPPAECASDLNCPGLGEICARVDGRQRCVKR